MIRYMLALGAATAIFSGPASAQGAFPSKPVHLVVCCTGTPEAIARFIANDITERSGVNFVVEPKAGANGILAASYVAKQPGDGYTILLGTNSTHAANQSLYKKLPYDFVADFQPISGVLQGYLMAVVNPSVKAQSIAELSALAKAEPDKINFGYGSSSVRAAAELYKQLAGVKLTGVSYKSNPQAATDLVGGRIQLVIADTVTLAPLVEAGKLRALAVTGEKRMPAMPQLPTMAEAGVPGYSLTYWLGTWAPASTPPRIIDRLNELIVQSLKSPRVREYIAKAGGEPFPTTPSDLMKFQVLEKDKWNRIVTGAGIEPE